MGGKKLVSIQSAVYFLIERQGNETLETKPPCCCIFVGTLNFQHEWNWTQHFIPYLKT